MRTGARHGRLGRYRQIVTILARHGFGFLVDQLGLGSLVPFHRGILGHARRAEPYTQPEHLRLAFEELGATFIKLGQILSTRADLLPPEYVRELSKLQDAVPPEPLPNVEARIEGELGRPVLEVFARFDPQPLGSASIGQVHAARLTTGDEVVVKVQRPGVEELIEEDVAILMDMARLAAGRTVWGQVYDLPGMVEEFAETLRGELDYTREASNAERIGRNFAADHSLHVPAVYRPLSTRRVLTMERLQGIKIGDLRALDEAGIDRGDLARTGARIVLKMVLEDGFFHADPHPGNFLVEPGPVIGLVDYGIVGRLDEANRYGLIFLFVAILDQDMDRVVDRLVDLGVVGTTFQLERLKADLEHLLSQYFGRPFKEIDVSRILEEFMEVARRHRLVVPTRLTLLGKTMSMHEGLARTLDPEFNMAELLAPRVQRLALAAYSPRRLARRLLPVLEDLGRLAVILPRRLDRLSAQAERGNFSTNIHMPEAEHYLSDLNRMVNRLIMAMLTTGFIVGLAVLMIFYHPPGWEAFIGWVFAVGFLGATVLGAWIVLSVLRGGYH
ncbi:MAG: ABC1 kinase family protein [Chloroflexota bacterium]